MSVSCKGCGRSFSLKGYNVHHSRGDAKPEFQGRENAQVASVAVNACNYRVSVHDASSGRPSRDSDARAVRGPDPDLQVESDSDGEHGPGPGQAPSHDADSLADAAGSGGSGPGESSTLHGIYIHITRYITYILLANYTVVT